MYGISPLSSSYYVFGFYPPQLLFNITIDIEEVDFHTKGGEAVWKTVGTLEIGPHQRLAKSSDFQVSTCTIRHAQLLIMV